MALPMDRFFRTLGFNRAAARIAAGYDEDDIQVVSALDAGIRAWLDVMPSRPIEYEILDVDPALPLDDGFAYATAGQVFMGWILSGNWDAELLRFEIGNKLGVEAMQELFPEIETDPAIVIPGKIGGEAGRHHALEILRNAPLTPKGQGSNNWVVAGSRTVSIPIRQASLKVWA